MTSIASTPSAVLASLVSAVSELSDVVLELSPLRVLAYRSTIPGGLSGAEVVVETRDCEYELALLIDPASCEVLDKALLGVMDERGPRSRRMRVGEQSKSPSANDAKRRLRESLCFLAEVVASAFARRLGRHQVTVRRPMFVPDFAKLLEGDEIQAAEVALGETRLVLVSSACGRVARRPTRPGPQASCGESG
jgi:hypothetical protein